MAVRIEPAEDGRLLVRFPYSPESVAKIKTIPGREWHPELKAWSVPAGEGMAERLRELFAGQISIDVTSAVLKRAGEELRLGGYSPKTGRTYLHHCRRYLRQINGILLPRTSWRQGPTCGISRNCWATAVRRRRRFTPM